MIQCNGEKKEKTRNPCGDQDHQRNEKKENRNEKKENRNEKKENRNEKKRIEKREKEKKGGAETSIKMCNRSLAIFLKFLQARRSKRTKKIEIKQN